MGYSFNQKRYDELWAEYRYHPEHARIWQSQARVNITCAGRRSGKTGVHKRLVVREVLLSRLSNFRCVITAPTFGQVKKIWWDDMKASFPAGTIARINETELKITLVTGATVELYGLERPERIEGTPIDLFVGDEWADVKPHAWTSHILPALDTIGRRGRAYLLGVPEGRNHFWKLFEQASTLDNWDRYWWPSWEVMTDEEIADARASLPQEDFDREYGASFEEYSDSFYSSFSRELMHDDSIVYDPTQELLVGLDFNVSPGVALLMQEREATPELIHRHPTLAPKFTAVVDEIYIRRSSNTYKVCAELLKRYQGSQESRVLLYGDASGGQRLTSQVDHQTDWDIVDRELGASSAFGGKYRRVSGKGRYKANPSVRGSGISANARLQTSDGTIATLFDANRVKHWVEDMEGTRRKASGEMDKKASEASGYTHLSDCYRYTTHIRYPFSKKTGTKLNPFR